MCPFCYLGDTLLERALDRFEHASAVDIRYHSYELMPHLPSDHRTDLATLLNTERGIPRAQVEAMNAPVAARATELGLSFRFDQVIATNTRTAHRLIHFAERHGRQHEAVQRLFRAYFTDGLDIGKHDVLADAAAEIGLDRAAVLQALASNAFDGDVDADIARARELGITGVPFFVFDNTYAISGAQPAETFLETLDTTWNSRA